MYQNERSRSKACLGFSALFALTLGSSGVFAQSTVFSDGFESGLGNWTVAQVIGTGSVTWAADATPATLSNAPATTIPYAGAACLNYNDGVSYDDTGNANSAYVTLNTTISAGSYLNPVLSFYQTYDTETGGFFDMKTLQISNDNFSTLLVDTDVEEPYSQRNKLAASNRKP